MLARIEGMSTALDYQKEWRDVTELRRSKAAVVEEVRSQNEHQPHAKDLLLRVNCPPEYHREPNLRMSFLISLVPTFLCE